MRLLILGAAGRMGQALCRAVRESGECELAGALERPGSPYLGADAGGVPGSGAAGVKITSDPVALFAQTDGVLDFTTPAVSVAMAALSAQARIVHVIGTTGFSAADEAKIAAAARHAVIVKSGNTSFGVTLLAMLVEMAASRLGPEYDIEILEAHHRGKADAPSGTALLLAEAAAAGRGIELRGNKIENRPGHSTERPEGAIGLASLRGGSIAGDHTVMFAGPGERIELTHRAEDRAIFARGAVKAALWARGKPPGLYGMRDVLGV